MTANAAHKCGVYAITHKESGRKYIGSSVNYHLRMVVHKWNLKRKTHANKALQCAYDAHGLAAFSFKPVLICAEKDLLFYEQICMDGHQAYIKPYGYNIRRQAESNLGVKLGPSPLRGRPSPKKGVKTGKVAWNKGVPCSEKQKEILRSASTGRIPWNKGVPVSQETKEKLSKALKGKKCWSTGVPMRQETKEKLSLSQKKRLENPEIREKLRLAKLGQKNGPYKTGNVLKTHCPKGHPYFGDNLYVHAKSKRRGCKTCAKVAYEKCKKNRGLA